MPGGGIKEEKFWMSRRVWASGLTLISTILVVTMPENVEIWMSLTGLTATLLGLTSWSFPKK